jgi:ATP-dependent Clp protease ATP-binding subunit ClpX
MTTLDNLLQQQKALDALSRAILAGDPAKAVTKSVAAKPKSKARARKGLPTPSAIVAELDKHVIGQTKAKKALAVGAYFHYDRIYNSKTAFRKSNICLLGPTGTGKTFLLTCLAQILNVPFVIADATEMTPMGYYGTDPHAWIGQIQAQEGQDKEHAIVFIDEADKLSNKNTQSSVKTTAVQQCLLKLLEGKKQDDFDTSKVLFVIGGAFADITARKNYTGEVAHEDLVSYGLIPEFVGRFPIIATLSPLGVPELKSILTEPVDNIVSEFTTIFQEHGVALEWRDEAFDLIAQAAIAMRTGARGLRGIVEGVLFEHLYELPDKSGGKIVIDKAAVLRA